MLFKGVQQPMVRISMRRDDVNLEIVCGNKRNKRQNGKSENSNGASPRRIDKDTIRRAGGLKNAIGLVNANEKLRSSDSRVNQRTNRYRKKKKTPVEIAAEKEQLQLELEQAPQYFKNLYGDDMDLNPPVIVVDGYNVLAEMVKQNKRRFRGKELLQQRTILETDIRMFSQMTGIRVCIVYDALENPNPDPQFSRQTHLGIDIVFCQDYEADKGLWVETDRYIEEGTSEITIVTSDNEARENYIRPADVCCKSSKMFIRELKSVKKEFHEKLELNNMLPTRNTLRRTLPSQTLIDLHEVWESLLDDA